MPTKPQNLGGYTERNPAEEKNEAEDLLIDELAGEVRALALCGQLPVLEAALQSSPARKRPLLTPTRPPCMPANQLNRGIKSSKEADMGYLSLRYRLW